MRDYYPTRCRHDIPKTVWFRTLWEIRDYDRLKLTGTDTESIRVIDRGLQMVPEGIRDGLWRSLQEGQAYPKNAPKAVYSRCKEDLIYYVAHKLYYI